MLPCSRISAPVCLRAAATPLGDRAYRSGENRTLAVRAGREPYFEPKKIYQGNGNERPGDDGAVVGEPPGRFYEIYQTRSRIEACFSAIKGPVRVLRPVRDI